MNTIQKVVCCFLVAAATVASLTPLVRAQDRAEVTIYRAAPGASQAEPWIQASTAGLTNVLGVLADDKTNTLWVCQNSTGGRGGTPVAGQTALRSFDLKSGAAKGTYPFPTNGGVCNDMAIASDGTVYATESFGNRIHRLRPGATALDVWATDPQLAAVDGVALLADGAVYVNTFMSGRLGRRRCDHRRQHGSCPRRTGQGCRCAVSSAVTANVRTWAGEMSGDRRPLMKGTQT
jgi:streptogramin lyase